MYTYINARTRTPTITREKKNIRKKQKQKNLLSVVTSNKGVLALVNKKNCPLKKKVPGHNGI
jgi:hypothetical protein